MRDRWKFCPSQVCEFEAVAPHQSVPSGMRGAVLFLWRITHLQYRQHQLHPPSDDLDLKIVNMSTFFKAMRQDFHIRKKTNLPFEKDL